MSAISDRIALWIWRDLSLRAGFREVVDTIPQGGQDLIVGYWAARIEEEIGDNRFIAALEKIRDLDCRGNRHESSYVAARALGPRSDEVAAATGVTQYGAADGLRIVQPDLFAATPPEMGRSGEHPAGGVEEVADI